MISTEEIESIIAGGVVYSGDGHEIGTVLEIYLDPQSGKPAVARVSAGIPLTVDLFLPLAEATLEGNALHVPYGQAQIKNAPRVEAVDGVSAEELKRINRHYADSAALMIRSEEQVRFHTRTQATERLRLRKYVVTEDVVVTVQVRREEFRLERETVPDAEDDPGADRGPLAEAEYEVILHAERPVVAMEVVPVEKVTIRKHIVSGQQGVTEQIRKEQFDTDGGTEHID